MSEQQSALEKFIADILALSPETKSMNRAKAAEDVVKWLEIYSERILSERTEWPASDSAFEAQREVAAKSANPRFVLRQWLLEEVIKKVESDTGSGKKVLGKVLEMACNPFEPWGAEGDEQVEDEEVREERRYCGMGKKAMLGFQCSCSS